MNNRMIKKLFLVFTLVFMQIGCVMPVYAASHNLGLSVKNKGDGSISVSVGGSIVGKVTISVAGKSKSIYIQNIGDKESVQFKTGVGTFTVTAVGENISNASYEPNDKHVKASRTITVTDKSSNVKQPTTQTTTTEKPKEDTRSKENNLSSLSVNEGNISPKFSANTTKYTVNLEGNKTKIKIDAKAKDSKAKVSGTGEKNLKVGKNTFVVKCTAENGSTRNYTIIVNVDEKPLVYTEYGKQKLGVVRNLEGVNIPAGFEKSTTQLDGQKIDAWTNKNLNQTISYLVDEQNKKAYYVIENGKIAYEYQIVDIDDRHFVIVPIDNQLKEREGFQFQKVQVREIELDGWTYQDKAMKNYVQVYLMNEKGEKHVYDYESTEAQLQIYTEATKEEKGIDVFMVTTIVFGLTSVALLGLSIYLKKKTNS